MRPSAAICPDTTRLEPGRNLASKVWINHLALSRFRNYADAELSLDHRPVVLTGANGAGKTNLLEAVSLLAPGRGLRRERHERLGQHKTSRNEQNKSLPWGVSAAVMTPEGMIRAGTAQDHEDEGRRRTKIDGDGASQQALAERFAIAWLTPDMDAVLAASPGERRRFLDRMVIAFDPAHAGRITRYDRAMRQRNRLLDENDDHVWFEALEAELAATGVAIVAARLAMVAALDEEAAIPQPAFPAARLSLKGEVERWLTAMPAIDAEDRMRAAARQARADGTTTMPGAHNSLFEACHSGTGLAAEHSSTGEQKALVISVALAHARLQTQRLIRPPILLLDDIVSHLDEERRLALFDLTAELPGQVWFSGTDRALFAPLAATANMLSVTDGRLVWQ